MEGPKDNSFHFFFLGGGVTQNGDSHFSDVVTVVIKRKSYQDDHGDQSDQSE